MKKSVLYVVLIVSLLFLTSCGNVPAGETPTDTAVAARLLQTGTEGVFLDLAANFPPQTVYDKNELVTIVEVHNKGNHDLLPTSCFVRISGFDPNIIKGGFDQPHSCAESLGGPLEGKTLFNTEGSRNQLEFHSPDISLPDGVPVYEPTLTFSACYNYLTKARPSVCIDPLFYQVTSEQKACIPKDVSGGGGQGGPVGVSYVNVDMVGGRSIFEINVRNYGKGRVLTPFSDIKTCGTSGLQYTDLDKVAYKVDLTNGVLENCKPLDGFVRLVNGQGKIICSFKIPETTAYETPLLIDLDYSYIDSIQRKVQIVKTPE